MSTSILNDPISIAPVTPYRSATRETTVSVVIPCYNEEGFIGTALENLAAQYPTDVYEVIVVDGMSTDRTREVVSEFQLRYPDLVVKLLDNPQRNIPHALNLGISAARGEIIARMDAHAVPSRGYIRRCVEVLSKREAEVVGMPCRVQAAANTSIARAIAIAVSHPFGIGDAKYRLSNSRLKQEEVDTVAFACFQKSLWRDVNGYDETLLTNEDYDFNYRVRSLGNRVILDRAEHCDYFARPTLGALAAQYVRYGTWKARMIKQLPRSVKLRHSIAPAFVTSLIGLAALGFWTTTAWIVLAIELGLYATSAIAFSYLATRQRDESLGVMLAMPLVFLTIHICWGASFLRGLLVPMKRKERFK